MKRAELIAHLAEQLGQPTIVDGKFNQRFSRWNGDYACLVVHTNGAQEIAIDFYEDMAQERKTPRMHGGDPTQQHISMLGFVNPEEGREQLEAWVMSSGGANLWTDEDSGLVISERQWQELQGALNPEADKYNPGVPIIPESFFKRVRALKLTPEVR